LVEPLRHGIWLLDRAATAESLAGEITAPYPSYVSHVSALYTHGVIDQVPSDIHVVSTAAPRRLESSRGAFRLHRMPVELFGGFSTVRGVSLATPEKALFDWAYLSAAAGKPNARLPETEWPASFRRAEVDTWIRRISSPRLQTMTKSLVDRRLASS
jgi:predicted transcriptional regulator of viral defense system